MSKDRIFAAAKVVLEREGVSGLTVRKVSHRAGLSTMAMYRHFADKDALLNALMDDGLTEWEANVGKIRAKSPMEWLEQLGEAYLEFALSQPNRFDAAFFLPAPRARRFPDDFAAGHSRGISMMMAQIDRAKAEGQIDEKPTLDLALTMSALGQGFVSMHRAGRFSSERQFKTLYRKALRHCLESFKPSGRAS